MPAYPPIDFVALAQALLDRAHALVPQWLPHGRERAGRWYVGDFDGGEGDSANVSLTTGTWIDNGGAADDRGGDLISLYARIRGLNNGQAALELMRDLGWERQRAQASASGGSARDAAPSGVAATDDEPPTDPEQVPGRPAKQERWQSVLPVPPHAPVPQRFRHGFKDRKADRWVEFDATQVWEYEFDGRRYGYVARFERIDSKGERVKDILPLTWCQDLQDPHGAQRWHWKQWGEPRPLYVPAKRLSGRPVLVVEGEKCALVAHELLGGEYDVVSWPGGCKAWPLANWAWLQGCSVVLWPDADAQRHRLTKAERESGADPAGKPYLPRGDQPGWQAMVKIGRRLADEHACTVCLCAVAEPGSRAAGWDVADAVAEGWDAAAVREYIRAATPLADAVTAGADAVADGSADGSADAGAEGISTPSRAGAGKRGGSAAWRGQLLYSSSGAIKAVRENVVLALDGLPENGLAGVPEAQGVVAFNEFTNDVIKLRDTPWGTAAGTWDETDELELGNWLVRQHSLPSMPRGTLEEAVSMVAKRHKFHPVRQQLDDLRGTWDGVKRLSTWLRRVCLEEDEWDDEAPLQQYLARVGTWLVMAICARVLMPGCKFDYMTIFEGGQGVGKSTLARLLGGDHFADTGLVLGDKDSYQNLQGVLVYEWGELDSLNKSEVNKVKQFISSAKDRFRASFDRRPKDYPRQVVFIGTTNEDHYLADPTGNRRMWPVRVTRQIDLEWARAHRAQLFAEALTYVEAGDRFHPTMKEQRELFEPQQQQRQIENAIQAGVMRYLYDEGQKVGAHSDNGTLVNEISAPDLLNRLGISVDKQSHVLLRQATAALRTAGWVRFRSSRGDRPWMFKRPLTEGSYVPSASASSSSTGASSAPAPQEAADACPF